MGRELLDLETRRRFVAFIQKYPGLHVREVARQLGEDQALLAYHLPLLVEAGLVAEERGSHYTRLFPIRDGKPVPASPLERRLLAAVREALALQIVLFLLDHGPTRHRELVGGLGLVKSHVSYYVAKLEKAGVVSRSSDGVIAVKERARVMRLLLENRPTRDLLDRFMDLWDTLYD